MMKNQKGQIIIIVLVFMGIVTTLGIALVGYASIEIRSHRQAVGRVQGLSIAEAGIEAAIWKLNNQSGYSGETGTAFQNGEYDVSITDLSGSQKLVRAVAYVPNSTNPRAKRVVQAIAVTGTTNVGFNYGVQVGLGGFDMSNNSKIIGNIYSGGNILGSNSATVEGTAIASGPTGTIDGMQVDVNAIAHFILDSNIDGNATAYRLEDSTVLGNVVATDILNCTISGDATYDTNTGCSVAGTATSPNPDDFVDPEDIALPISDQQIDDWEVEAEAGGTIGTQVIGGPVTLGPVKINGDLTVGSNGILTLGGTVWVTGDINLTNDAIVQLDPSFGSLSGVLLSGIDGSSTQGTIDISNTSQVLGSGSSGSFLMLLSQTADPGIAIKIRNNSDSSILYAPDGTIDISNSAALNEVTAYKLKISNFATVTYDSGLSNVNFSSGPSGGWEILDQTWQLIQ
jgi:Tfp pilus assembly protein PilX